MTTFSVEEETMQIPNCKIGEVTIEPAIYNGAGTVKKVEDVKEMARSNAGAILVGSITVAERTGNTGNVLWVGPTGSLNSLGIPNGGIPYYHQHLPEMVKIAHDAGKPLFVSVAGFKPKEFGELTSVVAEGGADGVELNFGCPNIWDTGEQKGIFSFYPDLIGQAIEHAWQAVRDSLVKMAKVSPYSNPFQLKEAAEVFHVHGAIHAVTTTNTFPNAYGEDQNGKPLITPGGGLAGFAGSGLKHIALGQVKQWKVALPNIDVIGVGGISSGEDMAEFFRSGKVVAVQVVTALLRKHHLDPHVLDRLLLEFSELPETEAKAEV